MYLYYGCAQQEPNHRIKALWERMLDYELGHFGLACELCRKYEKRDPAELFPGALPDPFPYRSNRDFVREVLGRELDIGKRGLDFVPLSDESRASIDYRARLNSQALPAIPWLRAITGGQGPSSIGMEKSSEFTLKNRTGLQMSPRHAREMLEAVHEASSASAAADGRALAAARGAYIAEADPLGTQFRGALKEEDSHLLPVRGWYVSLSLAASGAD